MWLSVERVADANVAWNECSRAAAAASASYCPGPGSDASTPPSREADHSSRPNVIAGAASIAMSYEPGPGVASAVGNPASRDVNGSPRCAPEAGSGRL